jgi:carbamoyl-phosphate synthase large subunit
MNHAPINILITGSGAPGAAGVINCLRQSTLNVVIVGVDKNPDAYGKMLVDYFETVPEPETPSFIPDLLSICIRHRIQFVLPLVTRELLPLSSAQTLFLKEGITILVSKQEAISVMNDKGLLYQTLQENQIPTPRFHRVNHWDHMKSALFDLGYPHKPVVIKPCQSNGSRGFRVIHPNIDEKDLLLHHKPNHTYMAFNALQHIFQNQEMPDYLVSEYLPGTEYTVDVFAQNGKALQIIPRSRLSMSNGISTKGTIEKQHDIIQYVSRIVALIKPDHLIGVQVKKAESGSFLILEINPRVQGTTVACLGAGINFPEICISSAMGNPFQYKEPIWGVQFFRYWHEHYIMPNNSF